jgi:hypothetical protein
MRMALAHHFFIKFADTGFGNLGDNIDAGPLTMALPICP